MNKVQLQKEQGIVYTFIANSTTNHTLPHALLFYGDNDAPVDEVADFIAKSIFCENDFACGDCDYCKRFDERRLLDFHEIDGRLGTIKKDQISELADQFVMTSREERHISVYVIHEANNITVEAANALLKFLEEPPSGVTAILTSTGKEKLLPTIQSRVIALRVLPTTENYEEGLIDPKAAMILSSMHYHKEEALTISASKDFNDALELANKFFNTLLFNYKKGIYLLFSEVADQLKGAICYNYFYNIVYQVFLKIGEGSVNCPYQQEVVGLKNYKEDIFNATIFLEEIIASQKVNYNFTLVLGKLAAILEGQNE